MLSTYPKYWSRFVWKLVRPTTLLQAIVTAVKIASTGFRKAVNLSNTGVPVSFGAAYETIQIKLSDIKSAKLIAGFSEKVDRTVFKYYITGIDDYNICCFCRSPENSLALLHIDFEVIDGIYFFKEHPTKFGVVNARGGEHCSFCTLSGNNKTIDSSGFLCKFRNSNSDLVNKDINETLVNKASSNGFSLYTILNACGIISTRTTSILKRVWKEGNSYFGFTKDDKLLQDRNVDINATKKDVIKPGENLTDSFTNNGCVILYNNSYKYIEPNSYSKISIDMYPLLEDIYPELSGITELDWTSFIHIVEANKNYNYKTTRGVDKPNTHKLLDDHLLIPSGSLMYSVLNVSIPNGTPVLNTVDNYDSVYLIYSDYIKFRHRVYTNISARSLLLNNSSEYGVIRVTDCQNTPSKLTAISTNGDTFGLSMRSGNYLHGIALVKSGKSFREDVIFKYLFLKPVLVKAGANFVIHIDK